MAKRHSRPYKRDLQDKALERLCKNLRPTLCGWLVCSRICDLPRVASGRGNDVFVKMMTKLSIALLFMFLSVVGYGQTWLRVVTCYDAGRFGAKTGIISKTLVSDVKIERYQGSDQCHITYIDNLGTKTHTPTVPNKPSNNGLAWEYKYRSGFITATMRVMVRKGIIEKAVYLEEDTRVEGKNKIVYTVIFTRL
jgi:hypothetical protein